MIMMWYLFQTAQDLISWYTDDIRGKGHRRMLMQDYALRLCIQAYDFEDRNIIFLNIYI